jgi:hypothetical protein
MQWRDAQPTRFQKPTRVFREDLASAEAEQSFPDDGLDAARAWAVWHPIDTREASVSELPLAEPDSGHDDPSILRIGRALLLPPRRRKSLTEGSGTLDPMQQAIQYAFDGLFARDVEGQP